MNIPEAKTKLVVGLVLKRIPKITEEDLKGRSRKEPVVSYRHACWHALHTCCGLKMRQIAREWECAESTVHSGITKVGSSNEASRDSTEKDTAGLRKYLKEAMLT